MSLTMRKNFTPYNATHQVRNRMPNDYENLLGDGLEEAFAEGIHDLNGLASILNERAVPSPNGIPWSSETLGAELARLANEA